MSPAWVAGTQLSEPSLLPGRLSSESGSWQQNGTSTPGVIITSVPVICIIFQSQIMLLCSDSLLDCATDESLLTPQLILLVRQNYRWFNKLWYALAVPYHNKEVFSTVF